MQSKNQASCVIKPHFEHNKGLAVNKANAQHNEIKTRLEIAKRSNALHLNNMNLNSVLPEVFKMVKLIRLDLSYNNIVKLSP